MSRSSSPTLSDSELLDSINDDPRFDLAAHRERRMQELSEEVKRVKVLNETDYGKVLTYGEEKKLIERMAKEKYCLIHFFHPDFHRCRIMDTRLEELAPKYTHTLFLRTSVVDSPFLVVKFGVQVLPCVHVFVDGRCVDRLIGFEELGQTDTFSAKALEFRLLQSGALPTGQLSLANTLSGDVLGEDGDGRSDSEGDDEHGEKKSGRRRGKVGIRNGLASAMRDDDEWDL